MPGCSSSTIILRILKSWCLESQELHGENSVGHRVAVKRSNWVLLFLRCPSVFQKVQEGSVMREVWAVLGSFLLFIACSVAFCHRPLMILSVSFSKVLGRCWGKECFCMQPVGSSPLQVSQGFINLLTMNRITCSGLIAADGNFYSYPSFNSSLMHRN